MASTALARTAAPQQPGASRIYYIDEGQVLRAIHAVRGADGKYRPTGIEERISFPLVQAAIARAAGRPDLHPTELGFSELGAGKLRRKIKHAAKKVAHSKILKKVAKAGMAIATGVTAVVPGTQGIAAGLTAVQFAQKAAQKAKAMKRAAKTARSSLSGIPLEVVGAAKARLPAAAVAATQQKLRASLRPTSAVATSTQQALLRESRINEAGKALALVPANKQAQAAKVIASRVDGYKVLTPRGNTVWVSKAAIAQA
jgi:hypothetical protein